MDSSISRAWTPYSIFLSDRNDPLWECWYNLSNLTNQWVYKELAYRNWSFKEMITGSAALSLPSFLPFYFRPRTFSIKRAQLSRNLEQATASLQPAFVAHRRSGWTLNRTVVNSDWRFDNLWGSHLQSQWQLYPPVDGIKLCSLTWLVT